MVVSGGLGESGYRRSDDEPRAEGRRQPLLAARRSSTTPATGRAAATSTTSSARSGLTDPPGIIKSYDASVSYGGPIKRDKLWFFGSYRKLNTETNVEGIVANANAYDLSRWDWAPDNSVTARQSQGRTMYIGRITAQPTPKHRFSFNHEYQVRCEGSPLKVETDGCHTRPADWIAAGAATMSPEARHAVLRHAVLRDAGHVERADDEQAAARIRLHALLLLPRRRPGPDSSGRHLRHQRHRAVHGDQPGDGYTAPRAARQLSVPGARELRRQLRPVEQLARLRVLRHRRAQHEGGLPGAASPQRHAGQGQSLGARRTRSTRVSR